MTTKQKSPGASEKKTISSNPKFRVIPNLSLRGKEIMQRLKNRSLILDASGNYSLNEQLDRARKMTKLDVMDEMRRNSKKINEIETILNNAMKKQTNAKQQQGGAQ